MAQRSKIIVVFERHKVVWNLGTAGLFRRTASLVLREE